LRADEAIGQHAHHLASAGVPERDRIEHGAGAERGDEGVDLRDLDQKAVEHAEQAPSNKHDEHSDRPRQAELVCRLIARMCHSTMP
jgi:hypothetical protein